MQDTEDKRIESKKLKVESREQRIEESFIDI